MNFTLRFESAARVVAALAISTGLAISARAQTVLIDFGNGDSFRGVSVTNPDANGNNWNSLAPGTPAVDMIGIDGVATTIDLYADNTGVGTDSFNGPAGANTGFPPTPAQVDAIDIDTAALGLLGVKAAAFDFAAGPGDDNATTGNNVRFQIQGLEPAKKYNLTFYAAHQFNVEPTTVYSIFTNDQYNALVASASLDVHEPGSPWLYNRDTVATLTGLSPQENDILYFQFVGATGHYGYLNSMQITAVPEPSALLLLVSGAALAFGIRRR